MIIARMCFWLSCAIDMFTRLNYINFTAFFQFYLSVVCFSLMLHGVLHNWRENYPFIRHLWSKQQHKVSPCISLCVCVFTACPTKMMLQLFCCLVLLFGNSVAQSNGKFLFFMMTIKKKGKCIHPYNNNCIILQRYISFLYIFTISAGQIGKYCSSKFDIIKWLYIHVLLRINGFFAVFIISKLFEIYSLQHVLFIWS